MKHKSPLKKAFALVRQIMHISFMTIILTIMWGLARVLMAFLPIGFTYTMTGFVSVFGLTLIAYIILETIRGYRKKVKPIIDATKEVIETVGEFVNTKK